MPWTVEDDELVDTTTDTSNDEPQTEFQIAPQQTHKRVENSDLLISVELSEPLVVHQKFVDLTDRCLQFRDQVKIYFTDNPKRYRSFSWVLNKVHRKVIPFEMAVTRIRALLCDSDALLSAFEALLPPHLTGRDQQVVRADCSSSLRLEAPQVANWSTTNNRSSSRKQSNPRRFMSLTSEYVASASQSDMSWVNNRQPPALNILSVSSPAFPPLPLFQPLQHNILSQRGPTATLPTNEWNDSQLGPHAQSVVDSVVNFLEESEDEGFFSAAASDYMVSPNVTPVQRVSDGIERNGLQNVIKTSPSHEAGRARQWFTTASTDTSSAQSVAIGPLHQSITPRGICTGNHTMSSESVQPNQEEVRRDYDPKVRLCKQVREAFSNQREKFTTFLNMLPSLNKCAQQNIHFRGHMLRKVNDLFADHPALYDECVKVFPGLDMRGQWD